MKTAAVICEYNPFHSGHSYMLSNLKDSCGFDRIVCFMSGNFVQRGEPAIMDKMKRTEMALLSGADLVFEIPAEFSTSSAGDFARCGVSMALKSGICTHLCFGLEPGYSLKDLNDYRKNILSDEIIRKNLKSGMPYPMAIHSGSGTFVPGPNFILGCEYLNGIEELDKEGKLVPYPVERKGNGYLEETISDSEYPSATALRKLISENRITEAEKYIPCSLEKEIFCFPDMLTDLLNDRLLRETDYKKYLDVSREIADRLRKFRYMPKSFSERVDETKTRQYTRSRISRALLHIVLGIRKERASELKTRNLFEGYRVLGYRTESELLSEMKEKTDIPVFTKNSKYYEACPDALYYDQIWHNVTGTGTELTRSPFIL